MASQTVSLVAVSENAAKKIALGSGGKIKVQAGTKYLLQTENSQVAPENITVKRIGKDLLVSFEGSEKPDVTLQGFFADGMDSHLYGVSEDGQLHAYLRTDGEGFYGPLLMADGESAPIALGGDGVAYSAPLVGETDDSSGFTLWPLLLGLAGGGAAAAIIHHNRDDGHKTHTSPAPTNIKVMDDVGPVQGQLSSGDITDDAHPAISGNGVPGAIIHLFDNGQEIGSTTVAPDGTWTLTPELADGEHSFDATQVVPGQKPSASVEVIDLIVDTLAPAKPTIEQVLDAVGSIQGPIANGGVTDDPAPTLSGKAEAGSTVTLYDNGQQMGSVVADANGQWSYTPATPLSEGEHLFSVDATDKAGNTSEPSDVFSIVTDYTAPVATLTIDVVAGDDVVNLFESKAQQLISGKAGGEFLPGDLVTFTLNGTTYSAAVNAAGDWKVAVAGADLAEDSSIHATLVAHDAAGNSTSVVADHAYSVDLDPPLATLAIDVVAGDDVVNLFESQVPQLISGKVGGEFMPGDLVTFTLNGTAYSAAVNASGDWKVTVAGADLAGETSIQATLVAHDAAGNDASVVADHAYIVDVTPPVATLSIDVVASDDVVNLVESQAQQTISGKAGGEFKAGDLVSFTLNGHAYSAAVKASGDWSVSVAGSDLAKATGIHAILVAHDAAGNSASVVADHAYTVDVTPPVATLTIDTVADDDVINLEESKVNQTVSGTAAGEFRAGDIVSFELNDVIYSAAVAADGKWSVAVAGSDLVKDTNIHATLVAHDAAGNVGNIVADHAYTVAVDPGTTTLNIDSVTGDDIVNLVESQASQTISGKVVGTYLAGDQVTFTLNGHAYSAALGVDGKWSVAVPGSDLVDDGGHQINATVIGHDLAGNANTATASHAYSVDVTPPVATLTIDVVAGDDVVNLEESKVNQTISGKAGGEFQAGDIVSFTLNTVTYSAAVATDGKWSVSVPGADLAKDTNIHATLVAHDAAGNSASVVADHAYMVAVDPGTTTLTIDTVAGDDIVNLVESQANQTISGKVAGAFLAGDKVTFTLNGHAYSAAVGADGKWSVTVPGSDLVSDSGRMINATVIGHDLAGNASTATVSHAYSVDVTPPVAMLSIDSVTSDNTIDSSEAAGNVTVSGKVSGEFTANDQVSFKLDGTTYSAAVSANGDWSVSVPGSKLVGDTGHRIDASLVAHDAAGNVGTITASHTYSVELVVGFEQSFADGAFNDNSSLAGYHSDSGDFTITGNAIKRASGGVWWPGASSGSMYVEDMKVAVVTFDTARSSVELGVTGIEQGNTAILKVFATDGTLLDTIGMTNPLGTQEILPFSYQANSNNIGRIEITGEGGGTHVTSISSTGPLVMASHRLASMLMDPVDDSAQDSAHILSGSEQNAPAAASDLAQLPAPNTVADGATFNSAMSNGSDQDNGGMAASAGEAAASVHLAQPLDEPAAADITAVHETTSIEPSFVVPTTIHSVTGISDSFYGTPGEGSLVTLRYVAGDYLASDANQGIHGAAGVDTLAVAGHDQVLDLTAAHGKVTGMEVIDLTGDGQAHNSLKLSLQDVLDNGQADLFHSGDSHSVQMLVKGDSSDVVNLAGNGTDSTWSDKGTVAVGDISYHVYQNSSTEAELLIQQGVQVHLVFC
ncbi:Ig-like domain-containing protein [Pseudomonas pseudonitroreducens]|uniref:Ig-like domain-containing protein n=1 Tax=Pseudomonas pseudonitroreducens TaxID=2892326 RepID=UPI001F39A9C3|nr:Ig-like domain-containing protein [Pseudomonas pseudonitroreducens]